MGRIVWLALLAGLWAGCGQGTVPVTNDSYEPRIVIEGFVSPGQRLEGPAGVLLTRNVRFDENLRNADLILRQARVRLVAVESGAVYPLVFDREAERYVYRDDDLVIEHGKSYTLEVEATVRGTALAARATTTVPEAGFGIVAVQPDTVLHYRPLDADGEVTTFKVVIERSPGTRFYLTTIRPLSLGPDIFVYDNPFSDESPGDVANNLDDFNYAYDWIQNTPRTAGRSTIELFWFNFWFYTDYRVIIYAADRNYSNFIQTFGDVQEEDGNFHEPVFRVEGDGIGVFGSYIRDEVRVRVRRE